MEILGIGTPELIAILIIMLVVAGPKRMIQWAYTLGQYTAKLRKMWAEMMVYVEKEMAAAGVDVDLPREIPTRGTVMREINKISEKAMSPVTKPIQDTMKEANEQLKEIKTQTALPKDNVLKVSSTVEEAPPANGNGKSNFGSWSGESKKEES